MDAIKIFAPTRRSVLATTLAAGAFGADTLDARRRPTPRPCWKRGACNDKPRNTTVQRKS